MQCLELKPGCCWQDSKYWKYSYLSLSSKSSSFYDYVVSWCDSSVIIKLSPGCNELFSFFFCLVYVFVQGFLLKQRLSVCKANKPSGCPITLPTMSGFYCCRCSLGKCPAVGCLLHTVFLPYSPELIPQGTSQQPHQCEFPQTYKYAPHSQYVNPHLLFHLHLSGADLLWLGLLVPDKWWTLELEFKTRPLETVKGERWIEMAKLGNHDILLKS